MCFLLINCYYPFFIYISLVQKKMAVEISLHLLFSMKSEVRGDLKHHKLSVDPSLLTAASRTFLFSGESVSFHSMNCLCINIIISSHATEPDLLLDWRTPQSSGGPSTKALTLLGEAWFIARRLFFRGMLTGPRHLGEYWACLGHGPAPGPTIKNLVSVW